MMNLQTPVCVATILRGVTKLVQTGSHMPKVHVSICRHEKKVVISKLIKVTFKVICKKNKKLNGSFLFLKF